MQALTRTRPVAAIVVVAALTVATLRIGAVTRLTSADGQFWDVQDTSPWGQDSGGIATGGYAYPFNGFGYLKLQVRRPDAAPLVRNQYLAGFGLASDTTGGIGRFDSMTPLLRGDVIVARALFAPADADYLRYVDSFTNVSDETRLVEAAWGARRRIEQRPRRGGGDVERRSADRRDGYVRDRDAERETRRRSDARALRSWAVGARARSRGGVLNRVGDMRGSVLGSMAGFDPGQIGYVFTFTLAPGQTSSLMTFVVKG